MKKDLVKVKLLRTHYLNSIRKRPGTVISVDKFSAQFLIERRVADPVRLPKK